MMNEPPPDAFDLLEARLEAASLFPQVDADALAALKNEFYRVRLWEGGQEELRAVETALDDLLASSSAENWPEPQQLSRAEAAPELPPELIPDQLRPWLLDVAERLSVPREMAVVPALVALASALGYSAALYPTRHGNWREVPNLWGLVAAPSSSMKTPAMEEGTRPLARLAAEAVAAHEATRLKREAEAFVLQARLEQLKKDARGPKAPATLANDIAEVTEQLENLLKPGRRFVTNDATVEMITELLRHSTRGMQVQSDELVGLLESFDKKGREGDRQFFLQAFNAKENYSVDRIGRGSFHIPVLMLSILGGIQPGRLEGLVLGAVSGRRDADGLLQRFQLTVYSEPLRHYKHVDRPLDTAAYDRAQLLFNLLADFSPEKHPELGSTASGRLAKLSFADDAQELFDTWLTEHMNRIRSSDFDTKPAFKAHLGKFQGLVAKLALLFHMVDSIESGHIPPVGMEALQLALSWAEFLEAHARKIYAPELTGVPASVRELALRILDGDVCDGTSVRDVYRRGWRGLKTAEQVSNAVRFLASKSWVRLDRVTTEEGGRPSEVIAVNPLLFSLDDEFNL